MVLSLLGVFLIVAFTVRLGIAGLRQNYRRNKLSCCGNRLDGFGVGRFSIVPEDVDGYVHGACGCCNEISSSCVYLGATVHLDRVEVVVLVAGTSPVLRVVNYLLKTLSADLFELLLVEDLHVSRYRGRTYRTCRKNG